MKWIEKVEIIKFEGRFCKCHNLHEIVSNEMQAFGYQKNIERDHVRALLLLTTANVLTLAFSLRISSQRKSKYRYMCWRNKIEQEMTHIS